MDFALTSPYLPKVKWPLFIAFVLFACSCRHEHRVGRAGVPEKFKADLDAFVANATRLEALTSQGVNRDRFGDQLATVRAQFDLLGREWPSDYKLMAKTQFSQAIHGWTLTYTVWNAEIETSIALSSTRDHEITDEYLLEEIRSYLERKVPKLPGRLHYYRTKRALMTVAADDYDGAIRALDSTSK